LPISRVLIANRGEIAVRVIRAADALGIETVLAVSDADRESLAARMAGRAICIGPTSAAASYLNVGAVLTAAKAAGADAIHPGYGFLAESPDLADACAENRIKLVGPSAAHMRQMGHKIEARALAAKCGVPTLPGSERIASVDAAANIADHIGLPVMLKAASGGAPCTWNDISPMPAISRCRYWAMPRVMSFILASAIAPPSGATRR